MRMRGKFSLPTQATTERMPLCVPALPLARMRSAPTGRSMSSYITIRCSGGVLKKCSTRCTQSPERFMYVCGLTSTTRSPFTRPSPYMPERPRLATRMCSACDSASIALKPALCLDLR